MELIKKYFPTLSQAQIDQLNQLVPLYLEWNERINVISRKDIENLVERHILHSLSIVKLIRFKGGSKILDVGTGGGFPGIPLAIMFPEVSFHLIDAIGKKIKVVQGIAQEIGLSNILAEQKRVEQVKDKYDFVVSRAVTAFPEFVKLSRKSIATHQQNGLPNGILYLKGGDFKEEIAEFGASLSIFKISDYFDEPFFETKKIIYLPI